MLSTNDTSRVDTITVASIVSHKQPMTSMMCSGMTAYKIPADSPLRGDGSMMLADSWGN